MKNLTPFTPFTEVEFFLHKLSSLVAADGKDAVVVSVADLVGENGSVTTFTDQFAEEVAAGCSKKFYRNRLQPFYDWHVSHNAELKCFVAIKRSHPDLSN